MDIDTAADNFFTYILGPMKGVPANLKGPLQDCMRPRNHAHVAVVSAVELIYRDNLVLPGDICTLGANMAEAASDAGAGGLNIEGRGWRIGTALRRRTDVPDRVAAPVVDPTPLPVEVEQPDASATPVVPAVPGAPA